jgi:23S rRNA pseudouridine2605 synthase
MSVRLQKVLAHAGIASRRASEEVIQAGRVTVNGEMVTKLGTTVDPDRDDIRVDGARIKGEKLVYWLVNKPRGVLCTSSDPEGRRLVVDIVPDRLNRLYPVGRLDEDSEGLIIVTNDGDLAQLVAHPRHAVEKIYDVSVRGEITREAMRKVESGIWLSEGKTGEARMRIKRRGPQISHVHITIREGRNREIRRMFSRVGHPVVSLRRIQIGPVRDPKMKVGTCRRLLAAEVRDLKLVAGGGRLREKVRTKKPARSAGPRRRPGPNKPATSRKKPAAGQKPAGKRPTGKRPTGGKPAGKRSAGKSPTGKMPTGKKPAGKKPVGKKPTGKKPIGKKPAGKRPTTKRKAAPSGKPASPKKKGPPRR